jgi:hypothetical protein
MSRFRVEMSEIVEVVKFKRDLNEEGESGSE